MTIRVRNTYAGILARSSYAVILCGQQCIAVFHASTLRQVIPSVHCWLHSSRLVYSLCVVDHLFLLLFSLVVLQVVCISRGRSQLFAPRPRGTGGTMGQSHGAVWPSAHLALGSVEEFTAGRMQQCQIKKRDQFNMVKTLITVRLFDHIRS